jgi:hypothetical protein
MRSETILIRHDPRTSAGISETDSAPSPLLDQARGYGQVAREARVDCARGVEAERELKRRGNGPGK